MKIITFLLPLVIFPTIIFADYIFITSIPSNAKVSILQDSGSLKKIGETPLKLTNISKSIKIVVEKVDYFSLTNSISPSKDTKTCHFTLSPFFFKIQIPDQSSQSYVYANKKVYADFESPIILPYGNYSFSHDSKKESLILEYKSPYIPYVAFFSSVTILSTILAITGGILAKSAFVDFEKAQNSDQLLDALGRVSSFDTLTWSSVGIGTGALIGTIITASLDARDKKRIKRFNGMNTPSRTTSYLSEFNEIVLLGSSDDKSVLSKMNSFISKYSKEDSPLIADVYLKRGMYYLQNKDNRRAVGDFKTVAEEFPSRNTYEIANKLLGDIYLEQKDFIKAYESYTESFKVRQSYSVNEIQEKRLLVLYELAKTKTGKYYELFLEETSNLRSFSKEFQVILRQQREELL